MVGVRRVFSRNWLIVFSFVFDWLVGLLMWWVGLVFWWVVFSVNGWWIGWLASWWNGWLVLVVFSVCGWLIGCVLWLVC